MHSAVFECETCERVKTDGALLRLTSCSGGFNHDFVDSVVSLKRGSSLAFHDT